MFYSSFSTIYSTSLKAIRMSDFYWLLFIQGKVSRAHFWLFPPTDYTHGWSRWSLCALLKARELLTSELRCDCGHCQHLFRWQESFLVTVLSVLHDHSHVMHSWGDATGVNVEGDAGLSCAPVSRQIEGTRSKEGHRQTVCFELYFFFVL